MIFIFLVCYWIAIFESFKVSPFFALALFLCGFAVIVEAQGYHRRHDD